MEKIITFSIAAYNVQNTLRNCLDSFIDGRSLNQIEVIIVDDGSKDSSKDIAQEYCTQYPDTFKLLAKENGRTWLNYK
nr:glycosyltransferase [Treponema zioleckii]